MRETELLARAEVIPGRSLTRSKAPGRMFDIGRGPMYAISGRGAEVFGVDGKTYVDMVCALGAVTLGHGVGVSSRPFNLQSLPLVYEVQAAERVIERVAPWASHVRFTRTGSEATHAAYRIAKRETGRTRVMMGSWAYHGWHEWCDDRSFPLTWRYEHGANLDEFCMSHAVKGEQIAAVFVEPHRWEATDRAWLYHVREFCNRTGAVLVFDEMIFGMRVAMGGATEVFGVTPDLACYGKALGNGAPIACVVGRDILAEHGELVSGTYSGEGAALCYAMNVLAIYETNNAISKLNRIGTDLYHLLTSAIVDAGWSGRARVEGSTRTHQRLAFSEPGHDREFAAQMASSGVLWHPSVINVMTAHSGPMLERVADAAEKSLRSMDAKA